MPVPYATLTSKGQLTVPKDVRERLGLSPGDRVAIEVDGENRATMRRLLDIRDLFGRFPTNGMSATVKEMRAAIEEAAAEHVTGDPGR